MLWQIYHVLSSKFVLVFIFKLSDPKRSEDRKQWSQKLTQVRI